MTLALIQSVPAAITAFDAADDQGCVEALNATGSGRDKTPRTAGAVLGALIAAGEDPQIALSTVRSGGNEVLYAFLRVLEASPTGLDFSTDENQAVLATYPAGTVRDLLLALGRPSAARKGLGRDAVLQDVIDARAQQTREQLESDWAAQQNAGINAAVSAGDRPALKAALLAAEAAL